MLCVYITARTAHAPYVTVSDTVRSASVRNNGCIACGYPKTRTSDAVVPIPFHAAVPNPYLHTAYHLQCDVI